MTNTTGSESLIDAHEQLDAAKLAMRRHLFWCLAAFVFAAFMGTITINHDEWTSVGAVIFYVACASAILDAMLFRRARKAAERIAAELREVGRIP